MSKVAHIFNDDRRNLREMFFQKSSGKIFTNTLLNSGFIRIILIN